MIKEDLSVLIICDVNNSHQKGFLLCGFEC